MRAKTNITVNEIISLYQICGISTDSLSVPRTTINTGNISTNYNYNSQLEQKFSDNVAHLRWA